MLASNAGGPGFNPQSRTTSYQRHYKYGTSSSLVHHSTLRIGASNLIIRAGKIGTSKTFAWDFQNLKSFQLVFLYWGPDREIQQLLLKNRNRTKKMMDKIWNGNPSKWEVIGRIGWEEKNAWPCRTDKSRTQKKNMIISAVFYWVYLLYFRVRPLNSSENTRKDQFAATFPGAGKIEVYTKTFLLIIYYIIYQVNNVHL